MINRLASHKYLALGVLTLAALWIRFTHSRDGLLGWDELIILRWCEAKSLWELMGFYERIGNHMFQTLMAKLATTFVSNGIEGARLPNVLAGTALIPVSYFLARDFLKLTHPLILPTILAGSSWEIFWSTSARGYGFQTLFVVLQLWLTQRVIEGPRSRTLDAAWTATWVAHFYTLPTAVWFVLPLVLYTFLEWRRVDPSLSGGTFVSDQLRRYSTVGVIVGSLYGLAMLNSGRGGFTKFYPEMIPYWTNFLNIVARLFSEVPANVTQDFGILGKAVFLASLAAGLILAIWLRRNFLIYFLTLFAILLAFNVPIKEALPLRVFAFMSPLLLSFCCIAVDQFLTRTSLGGWWRSPIGQAVACLIVLALMSEARWWIGDYVMKNTERLAVAKEFVAYMGREDNQGKPMVGMYPQFRYWADRVGIRLTRPPIGAIPPELIAVVRTKREGPEALTVQLVALYGKDILDEYSVTPSRITTIGDIDVYSLKMQKK